MAKIYCIGIINELLMGINEKPGKKKWILDTKKDSLMAQTYTSETHYNIYGDALSILFINNPELKSWMWAELRNFFNLRYFTLDIKETNKNYKFTLTYSPVK